jgi:hypothetical protein
MMYRETQWCDVCAARARGEAMRRAIRYRRASVIAVSVLTLGAAFVALFTIVDRWAAGKVRRDLDDAEATRMSSYVPPAPPPVVTKIAIPLHSGGYIQCFVATSDGSASWSCTELLTDASAVAHAEGRN